MGKTIKSGVQELIYKMIMHFQNIKEDIEPVREQKAQCLHEILTSTNLGSAYAEQCACAVMMSVWCASRSLSWRTLESAQGLSLEIPKTTSADLRQKVILYLSLISLSYHVFSDLMYILLTLPNSPRLEDFIPFMHIFGYGCLSICKMFVLWYKRGVFRQLVQELAVIWPIAPLDDEAQGIKNKSLAALKITSVWYFLVNVIGVWIYIFTPILTYLYQRRQQQPDAQIGFVWVAWYPFDKYQPIAHVFVYIFEMFIGQTCVWVTTATDILFSAMASHISLLLRLLQQKLESIAATDEIAATAECYKEIVENIKLHQRLIKYCNDLENAFAVSMLVNYILSSINLCCVVFTIMFLEPFLDVGNKLFFMSTLIQIGMICWYGEDILHANAEIPTAAYNSGWYRTNPKCREALQLLILRAQKPIAFTAMKFTNISLATYTTILTRSYSYLALLYTMYNEK